jgi:tRNA G18 (ribose-2'-O)-methylase SpoU
VFEYLYRRNTVLEALRGSRRNLRRIYLQQGKEIPRPIIELVKDRSLQQEVVSKQQLTQLVGDGSHQGIALEVEPYPYCSVEEIIRLAGYMVRKISVYCCERPRRAAPTA